MTTALKERNILSLGEMIDLAERLRIDFGGTHRLNQEQLNIIYNSLRLIHRQAKKSAPPVFGRKIAQAQAAITAIKSKKKPDEIEKHFEKLIEHLTEATSLLGLREPAPKRRAA
ncbi:MAG: hypothetical protein KAT77_02840 [Nanoarchaeota archaeon]|nr:hypothetical protein [Nanoarchaeota archaeon]